MITLLRRHVADQKAESSTHKHGAPKLVLVKCLEFKNTVVFSEKEDERKENDRCPHVC